MSILKNIRIGLEATIGEWCKEMGIKNYNINKNNEIDIYGSINLSDTNIEEFLYPFGEVTENFDCSFCKNLKSLEGAPQAEKIYHYKAD